MNDSYLIPKRYQYQFFLFFLHKDTVWIRFRYKVNAIYSDERGKIPMKQNLYVNAEKLTPNFCVQNLITVLETCLRDPTNGSVQAKWDTAQKSHYPPGKHHASHF